MMVRGEKTKLMKYWLACSDYTIGELANEVSVSSNYASKIVKEWVAKGLVEQVSGFNGGRRAYAWCGEDDLALLALRAATHLRDVVKTPEALTLARAIFVASEREAA